MMMMNSSRRLYMQYSNLSSQKSYYAENEKKEHKNTILSSHTKLIAKFSEIPFILPYPRTGCHPLESKKHM